MNYSELSDRLVDSLSLSQKPVFVAFANSLPPGIEFHGDRVPAGCRFWQDATNRTFATSAGDHALCAVGLYTHNLAPLDAHNTDLPDALKVFADLSYVTEADLPFIPVLSSRFEYVVYGPLTDATLPPAAVLLFVSAAQSLIAAEAIQQVESQLAPAMGRPACAVIPQVVNTGHAAVSLGCCGARAYLDIFTPDISVAAIPGANLLAYVERIEKLSQANAVLTKFHEIRRSQVVGGARPSVMESLAALSAGQ